MADSFSKDKRSEIMRAVKSSGNISTELKLIQIFKKFGIRGWRRNYKLTGNPDFVFPKQRVAIFADGCFWHGHGCRNIKPKAHANYWQKKIQRNKERDTYITKLLQEKSWRVVRLWECEIKDSLLKHRIPNKLKFIVT